METQTKSCLLPLKKRADASFSSSTKRDRDNEYMQDHYGPRFCNNLPRQNSNPQKTHVPHLITLSAGKKNPFQKKIEENASFKPHINSSCMLCLLLLFSLLVHTVFYSSWVCESCQFDPLLCISSSPDETRYYFLCFAPLSGTFVQRDPFHADSNARFLHSNPFGISEPPCTDN